MVPDLHAAISLPLIISPPPPINPEDLWGVRRLFNRPFQTSRTPARQTQTPVNVNLHVWFWPAGNLKCRLPSLENISHLVRFLEWAPGFWSSIGC